MPRGEHFQKVDEKDILEGFDRAAENRDRWVLTSAEIATELPVTAEAVRQRIHKMDEGVFETVKLGGTTLWKKNDAEVFVRDDRSDVRIVKVSLSREANPLVWLRTFFSRLAQATEIVAMAALLSIVPALLGLIPADMTVALFAATFTGGLLHGLRLAGLLIYEELGGPIQTMKV